MSSLRDFNKAIGLMNLGQPSGQTALAPGDSPAQDASEAGKLSAEPAGPGGQSTGVGPGASARAGSGASDLFHMRTDKDKLTLSQDNLRNIPHAEPPKVKTRAEVEQALQKFLEELGKSQKHKTNVVQSTDKVWQADAALHQGLTDGKGPFTHTGGDGHAYEPADLARKIAQQLPDCIPLENFEKFQKLTAKDTPLPGSTTDQIRKKYEETRDKIVAKLPEKVRKIAKEAMDKAVEKGLSAIAGAALKGTGLNSDVQEEMNKAVDDYAKKATVGKSDED